MNIRQKGNAVRVTFNDPTKPQTITYVLIDPASCWCSTFNAWGKAVETPIIALGGKQFKIILEEIQ